jgi:ribosome-associated toxin RatA of RatAB toxin-antitoxin module
VKELHGTASAQVRAQPRQCLELLATVERYPSWYPEVVRRVEVLERRPDGTASRAHTTLHVAHGPLAKDFELLMSVDIDAASSVRLTRIPHDDRDSETFAVVWRIGQAGDGTRIELALDAHLSVPRLIPTGPIGGAMATGFVQAAARALG